MIGNSDATTRLEHNRNSSRERFRNPNLDFIAVADPRFSGNLRIERQPAREDEIRRLRNDPQSRLPDQEFFKTPASWNISSDDDLPRAAAEVTEVRSRYFGQNRPASTLVQIVQLASPEYKIEIEAIAIAP